MKTLALAIGVLVAGCAATKAPAPATYARLAELQDRSEEISKREQQCIHETVIRSHDQVVRIAATPDAVTALQTQSAKDDRDRELSQCEASAERDKDELSTRERAEYQGQAEEDRDRNALMMTLTTSHPR